MAIYFTASGFLVDVICADDFMPTGMMYTDRSEKRHVNRALDAHIQTEAVHRAVLLRSPYTAIRTSPAW